MELADTEYDPLIKAVRLKPQIILLELTLRNSKQLLCAMSGKLDATPPYDEMLSLETIRYLIAQGGIQDQTHIDSKNILLERWQERIYIRFYPPQVVDFYNKLHKHVAELLVLSCRKINKPIDIFSFGCGSGKELKVIKQKFFHHQLKIPNLYGFDINPNNFTIDIPDSDIQLIAGDVAELENLLSKTAYSVNSHKIGLFLGILVDGCMTGNYPALQILQQARIFDRILISGVTQVKFNKELLKAAGYNVKMTQTNLHFELNPTSESFFYLTTPGTLPDQKIFDITPMSPSERKYYLIKRSTMRSSLHIFDCLDLSMSANPLRDLNLFCEFSLEKVKQVDISWSYLQEDEISPFLIKLATLQRPLHLLLSPQQVKSNSFIERVLEYANITLIERLDAPLPVQCPMFSPNEAKHYGLYEKLPNRVVEKRKIKY